MVRQQWEPVEEVGITLASLAVSNGRVSDQISNGNGHSRVCIYFEITTGATAAGDIDFYLIRDDQHTTTPYRTLGLGTSDAAFGGTIDGPVSQHTLTVGSTATTYYGEFIIEDPGCLFSILLFCGTGATTSATEADSFIRYRFID